MILLKILMNFLMMTNLQNALNLLFVARSAIASLEALDCPDEIFNKSVQYASEAIMDIYFRLCCSVPSSEICFILNPISNECSK